MKKILKCKVTIILFIILGMLSVIGFIGRGGIYCGYKTDVWKKPYFTLVFEGIHDGIYPWDVGKEKESVPEHIADKVVPEVNGSSTEEPEEEIQPVQTGQIKDLEPKKFVQVEESYFDDAVFIGDSRTVGLHDYGGMDNATFYATIGLNVYDLWKDKFCEVDGEKLTLEEALKKRQYGKIYFQVGINEMGRGTLDGFMETYQAAVQKFLKLQPDAVIYVQGIMHVAKVKSESDEIFNNEGIQMRNERIAQLADNIRVFYIDMNEVVCDEEGNLREELTFDNVHLYGSKYNIWVDFLKTKGIEDV